MHEPDSGPPRRPLFASSLGEPPSEPTRGDSLPVSDPPTYPMVHVSWHDAWFDFDQQDATDARSDYLVRTVGFLINDGPAFISLAQEILPDGDGFRAVTHIPRAILAHEPVPLREEL